MRRFLLALVPLALVACTAAPAADPAPTTSSLPKGDLAVLAERIEQRRAELGTATFRTEGFASDGQATEVRNVATGAMRQGADGVTASMTMDVSTGGQPKKIALVVVRDGTYVQVEGAPMPRARSGATTRRRAAARWPRCCAGSGRAPRWARSWTTCSPARR